MAWFLTLASKMTGKEIPGVGMAPGGKIKEPKEKVEEHLQNFLAIADAMAENKNWGYLAHSQVPQPTLRSQLENLTRLHCTHPDPEFKSDTMCFDELLSGTFMFFAVHLNCNHMCVW